MTAPASTPRIAAFFDMDRTVVRCDTKQVYLESLRDDGELGLGGFLQAAGVLMGHKLALLDMEKIVGRAAKRLRGVEVDKLRARCLAVFEARIRPLISRAAIEAIEGHRRLGHLVVLLTAQAPYLVQPVADALGIEDFLCTELAEEGGRLTGALDGPLCYGRGKISHAQEFATARNIDLQKSYFYTDSYSDLPMLQAVKHRRVVNPDPRLRVFARRREWPILRFQR